MVSIGVIAQDQPNMVNIPGTIQPSLGCPGEWQPDCEGSALGFDEDGFIWTGTFELPAGNYEYKVAINGSWGENYGGAADQDGPNIQLGIPEDTEITFYYDHGTNWVADDVRHTIVTAYGTFQSELGCTDDWQAGCMLSWLQDIDGDGIYTRTTAPLPAGDYEVKAAINRTDEENYGADGALNGEPITFSIIEDDTPVTFVFDPAQNILIATAGASAVSASNLRDAKAHWVTADTVAWNIEPSDNLIYAILYSDDASMTVDLFGLTGNFRAILLELDENGLGEDIVAKFPHLKDYTAFRVIEQDIELIPDALKSQMAVSVTDQDTNLIDITGLQIPGVLDDLYTYDGDLGITFDGGAPTFHVWAPTAHDVAFNLYDDSGTRTDPTVFEMELDIETGVWSITGEADWYGKFYQYGVDVYVPTTGQFENSLVTDPYSVSLSVNSLRSQIIDLDDADFMPGDWADLEKPTLGAPEDSVIYELHIRDFSIFDETVPENLRGTFSAFTVNNSYGMQHLQALADVGLTHLHLLPAFDIATINENRERLFEPDYDVLLSAPSNSDAQQEELFPIRDLDGYNWGYDPYHYSVPEGSYATEADGPQRLLEFREMVRALNESGLRVVMDVVYNHTNASGQSNKSVLDKIVPGYYHRLDDTGKITRSTCCENTATEHNMMRKLMIDSVLMWAREYKVDGFRFDLMGHHMLQDMIEVREALDSLTLENDGVDGKSIILYGEGWNFGEVADNARGVNATQLNIGGTGIAVFNDRIRDAIRGGNPFGDYQVQGFVNGLFTDPNGITPGDEIAQKQRLLLLSDQIRIGLVGNLRDYLLQNGSGVFVTGAEIDYNGAPAGYTVDPQENISYASAHDNETLFDVIQYKAPADATVEDRVRMQNLGISIVGFSQGIPFYHAGVDMLRSKSFDKDSYNSGDWFNRLDFTYESNNFGVGLPPAEKNQPQWAIQEPLLNNPDIVPDTEDIVDTVLHTREVLQIRKSSPLFRLQTAEQVQEQVIFLNTGPDQIPGVIAMALLDSEADIDPDHHMIIVIFNARNEEVTLEVPELAFPEIVLHSILQASHDEVVTSSSYDADAGAFTVPAYTTGVFVLPQ